MTSPMPMTSPTKTGTCIHPSESHDRRYSLTSGTSGTSETFDDLSDSGDLEASELIG